MPNDSLKQYVPFWFRTGLLVLAILGVVFAGFVLLKLLNGPARHTLLSRAYELLGLAAQSDDIGWFDIDCINLSNEAIAQKWNNENLQRVALKGATVDDRFFASLRRHEELRKVKFEGCNLTNGGLGGLLQVGDLLWLEFDRCSIDAKSLASIKEMRNPFKVSMTDCSLTDQHLQSWYGSKIAISLTLIEDKITTGGILALRQANPSWKIELPGRQPVNPKTDFNSRNPNVIPSVDEISTVSELEFSGMHVSDVAKNIAKDAPNLNSLVFRNDSVSDDGLESIRGLENLEQLHLDSVKVLGPGLQYVPVNVKELWLFSKTDVAWKHLDRLVKLESLEINDTHVSEGDLRAIHGLRNLKSLTITSENSQWDGLEHLPQSLVNVGIFSGVTNDAVKQLCRLNELETLAVGGELISDDVCNDLAKMKSLRMLELHNTAITEAGLEVLTKAFGMQPDLADRTVISLQKE